MNQKELLTLCPHFDDIINSEFLEDDYLTKRLIEYYQEYVFNNDLKRVDLISNLDQAIYKYVNDYQFAKKLKNTLDVDEILKSNFAYIKELMDYIVTFYNEYHEIEDDISNTTKWL